MWVKYYSPDGYPYCYNEDTQESRWVDESSSELHASFDCKKQEDSNLGICIGFIDKNLESIARIGHSHPPISAFIINPGPVMLPDDSYLAGSDEVSSPSSAHENDVSFQGKRMTYNLLETHLLDTDLTNGRGIRNMKSTGKERRVMEHEANQDISDKFQTNLSRIQFEREETKVVAKFDKRDEDFEYSDIDSDFDGDNSSELHTSSSNRKESSLHGDYSRGRKICGTLSKELSITSPIRIKMNSVRQDSRRLSKFSYEADDSTIYQTDKALNHNYYKNAISDDSQFESDTQSVNGHVSEFGEHTDFCRTYKSSGNDIESTSDSASDCDGNSSRDTNTNTNTDIDSKRDSDNDSNIDFDSDSDIEVASSINDEEEQVINDSDDSLREEKNHCLSNDNRLHRQDTIFSKKSKRLNKFAELKSRSGSRSGSGVRASSIFGVKSDAHSASTTPFSFQEEISFQMFLKTDDGIRAIEIEQKKIQILLAKKCKKVEALKKIAYEKQEEKVKNQGFQSKFLSIFSLKDILLTNRLHIRSEREKEKEKEEENIFELAKYSNTKDLEDGRNSGDANLDVNIDIDIDIDIDSGSNTRQLIETKNHKNFLSFEQNHQYRTVEDDVGTQMNLLGHINSRDDFDDRHGNGNSDNNHDISFGDCNFEQATHNPITCHGRHSNRHVSKRRSRIRDRGMPRHMGSQMEKCTTHHIRERMNVRKLENIHKERYKQSFTDIDTDTDSISSNDSDILLIAAPIFSTAGWYQLSSMTDIGHLFLNAISKIKERRGRERERGRENDLKNSNGSNLQNISFVDESQIDEHLVEDFQLEESHSHSLLRLSHLAEYANNIKFSLHQKTKINEIIFNHLQQIIRVFVVFLNYFVALLYQVICILCKRFLD